MQTAPQYVFIVPYRNRETHLQKFITHMPQILEGMSYKFLFVHQCDDRMFNRGALKNIGFLFVKQSYPNTYQNIILVFNDLDCLPRHKGLLNYYVKQGEVKHFYGYTYALGGIVAIRAGDFERIGGYPNFWGWGYEDNMLQKRVLSGGLKINRDVFFKANTVVIEEARKHGLPIPTELPILQDFDGNVRTMNVHDFLQFSKNTRDGIMSFKQIVSTFNNDTGFLDVTYFDVGHEEVKEKTFKYDLANGSLPLVYNKYGKMHFGV